jgi:uncharacterized membrane protein
MPSICGKTISITLMIFILLATFLNSSISQVSSEIPSGDLKSPYSRLFLMAISTIFLYSVCSSSYSFS